tara:strand:+ start:20663 stop:22534 length:1872 start_codon:yes stop_codon:yes gene_type:complete
MIDQHGPFMDRIRARAGLLIFIIVTCASVNARPQLELSSLNYYYDSKSTLGLDEFIADIESRGLHEPFESADIPVGYGDHWLFGDIEQLERGGVEQWIMEINFPNIDRVEAFVRRDDGSFDQYIIGDEVAFTSWPNRYRKPSIPLNLSKAGDTRIYFRVNSETPLIFPIETITKQDLEIRQGKEYFLYGMFYGSIFILALYNAGVYFSLRDKSYLYYVLYILSFSVVQASTTGMGQQYLWPGLSNVTTRIALLSMLMTNYFLIYFVIHFLDVRSYAPALLSTLRWIAGAALLCIPALLLSRYAYIQYSVHVLNIFSMISIVFVISRVFQRNRRPAMYLIVGYSVLFCSIILALLFQANFIGHYHLIDFSVSAAIIFEAIILSIGLSDRIARLRLGNELAEKRRRVVQEQLSRQLIQAREYERAEISRQLHDGINHDLVVIQKKIARLADSMEQPHVWLTGRIDNVNTLLNSTINDIRNISHVTHPRIVKHLGLERALCALMKSSFDSSFMWDLYIEEVPLCDDIQLLLYRAVQEATTNIIKHAKASECLIRLQVEKEHKDIRFVVKDDGRGFVPSPKNWRFGLRTLNEHCKSLSGQLSIESVPGNGSSLTIILPLIISGGSNE